MNESGIFRASDLRPELSKLYEDGPPKGRSTGWRCLDEFYTVKPGELTVITGVPGSGKSNFLDALGAGADRRQVRPEPPERQAELREAWQQGQQGTRPWRRLRTAS